MSRTSSPTDNTAICDCHDPEFAATDQELLWRDDQGGCHHSIIYQPSRVAVGWDLGEDHPVVNSIARGCVLRAIGSRFGCFSYVVVQDRSRVDTPVPYYGGRGRRVQVSTLDTDGKEDQVFAAHVRTRPGF